MLHELPGIITKAKFNCSGSISLSDTDCFGQSPGDPKQVHLSSGAREDQRWRRCDSADLQPFLCSTALKSNSSAMRCCFRLKTFQCGCKVVKPGASKQEGFPFCSELWCVSSCVQLRKERKPRHHSRQWCRVSAAWGVGSLVLWDVKRWGTFTAQPEGCSPSVSCLSAAMQGKEKKKRV